MSISASIVLALLAAILAPWMYRFAPRWARFLLPLAPFGLTAYFCTYLPGVIAGEAVVVAQPWVPPLGLSLAWKLDGLSLTFAILITGIGGLITLYAGSYLETHPQLGRFYGFLFLFQASMLGVVLADDAIALFVFWELTSLSSYFLIGFDHEREAARSAALQALLVTGVGGFALLAGALILGQVTGTYRFSELYRAGGGLSLAPQYTAIVLLFIAAAFTKSAQFPFHFWLPRAMEAPTPVSAYLHAATMVKAGVYLLARLSPILSGSVLWHQTLIWAGAFTALLGGALALGERHFKRVLAYSTVGALGIMVLLVGIGTGPALQALVAFLVAHALYKGALFLVAGAVHHAAHDYDVERLGGLRTVLPMVAVAAGLAALSMGGVPPLFGFISKELLFSATLDADGASLLTACALTASAFFLAVGVNVGLRPFWARPATTALPAHGVPWPLWLAPILLAIAGVVLGLRSDVLTGLFQAVSAGLGDGRHPVTLGLWHGLGAPLLLSAVALAMGLAFYRARSRFRMLARWFAPLGRAGPARGYELSLRGLNWLAVGQTRLLQRGYLRVYLVIILSATLLVVGYTLIGRGGLPSLPSLRDLRFYEAVIAVLILVAALAAIRARSRFASILSLGVVGYGVALIFILFGGPDLGITQLVVETLTVVLLILAFYHLPRFAELSSFKARARDAVISLGFGALMTTLVLMASETRVAEPVSKYYGDSSLPAAHGRNVVNVILTDFRALDTLGEITVLATAAFGVLAVLKLRPQGGASK